MSRRKTKAENIRNPEHYFNSMIKKLERDGNKTAKYHAMFISYDEITDMDCIRMNRDILLQLATKQDNKVPSGSAYPKVAMAGCFAMIFSAYNGTPTQPQPSRKGSSSERSSEG